MKNLTPKEIVKELNKYIISQDEAKKNVAIALRNRDRRKSIKNLELRKEITPKNIILAGSTGVGKTEIARRIALIADAPFIKVDATKYTEVGYVGKDVETIIKDLLSLTIGEMKDKKFNELNHILYNSAVKKVASILRPLDKIDDNKFDQLVEEITAGNYDDEEIEITAPIKNNPPLIEVIAGGEEIGSLDKILEQMTSNISKTEKIKTKVKNAINIFLEEEIEKKVDINEIIQDAINEVESNGIIFIDEIDKIIETNESNRSDVSRSGVQRDILPIVEGTTVVTKYGSVKTEHILFIAAGAFSNCSPSDLMPELQGRFPIIVNLKKLEKDDFIKILTETKYNLLKQYKELLLVDNVELSFTESGIEKIADLTFEMNEKVENIGARRLSTIIEQILKEVMFEAPYDKPKKIIIDTKYVQNTIKEEIKEEDLDKFIL